MSGRQLRAIRDAMVLLLRIMVGRVDDLGYEVDRAHYRLFHSGGRVHRGCDRRGMQAARFGDD